LDNQGVIPPLLTRKFSAVLFPAKLYEDYADALEACGNHGYEDDFLCSYITIKTKSHILENPSGSINSTNICLLAALFRIWAEKGISHF